MPEDKKENEEVGEENIELRLKLIALDGDQQRTQMSLIMWRANGMLDVVTKSVNAITIANGAALIATVSAFKDYRNLFASPTLALVATLFAMGLICGMTGYISASLNSINVFGDGPEKSLGRATQLAKGIFVSVGLSLLFFSAGIGLTIASLWRA
jgi:hypothetical protein